MKCPKKVGSSVSGLLTSSTLKQHIKQQANQHIKQDAKLVKAMSTQQMFVASSVEMLLGARAALPLVACLILEKFSYILCYIKIIRLSI